MMSRLRALGGKEPEPIGVGKGREAHLGKSGDVGRYRQARVARYRIRFYSPCPHLLERNSSAEEEVDLASHQVLYYGSATSIGYEGQLGSGYSLKERGDNALLA